MVPAGAGVASEKRFRIRHEARRHARRADNHAQCAPRAGHNVREIWGVADDARDLKSQLAGAIDQAELSLYYPPSFNCRMCGWVGSEELLRWNLPLGSESAAAVIEQADAFVVGRSRG